MIRHVLDRTFRTNPAYELVQHHELPAEERGSVASLAADPDHWGVLLPAPRSGLGVQAVDRAGADLLAALLRPGPLPPHLRAGDRDARNRRVVLLVMDGVLEIESDGRFVSGPAAHGELLDAPLSAPRPTGAVGRLSDEALRRAQHLPIDEAGRLRAWLYGFGAVPLGPAWARRVRGWADVERLAGIGPGTAAGRRLREAYRAFATAGWMSFRHQRGRLRHADPDGLRPAFKMYVSPRPGALGDVVPALVEAAAGREVAAFKMGRDARGILRPDKLVLYFDESAPLHDLAGELAGRLAGCPAQGVPFTAALAGDGLLSWGVDPPRSSRIPGWRGSESWRVWITERLARALLRSRLLGRGDREPRLVALDRVRAEGIDPDGWLPSPELWRGEA